MKKIYKGLISQKEHGENWRADFIGDLNEPITQIFQEEFCYCNVTVRYFISEIEKTIDELQENLIQTISGYLEADYTDRYSEITGYLWTDEEIKIGGHDLLDIIASNVGKYIYLEVEIHD